MTEYDEDFITTYTGIKFHYLEPKVEEVDIWDITHALSLKCRFGGHCRDFYLVAEHSIHVAHLLPPELKLCGLLHDATEAYMPDVPRPIKLRFGLKEYEDTIFKVIAKKFGIWIGPEVKEADDILLATESRDLLANTDGWAGLPEPLRMKINPIPSSFAESRFLVEYTTYTGGGSLPLKRS
jgi:hypothetical protein